jgi:F-type H+-transporting ATPase subunit a
MLVQFMEDLCNSTLGEEHGRKYMPFVGTIFVFTVLANMVGVIPNPFPGLQWSLFTTPTQDLNTPLGLAIIVVFVVHISAIKIKGFRGWLWDFFEPSFPADVTAAKVVGYFVLAAAVAANYFAISSYVTGLGAASTGSIIAGGVMCALLAGMTVLVTIFGVQLGRVPNVFMAPLNFIGEIGKSISHPFRLYGNVFGGFVITLVLSELIYYVGLPVGLNVFFGIFIGIIQAFVFAMLALAYVAVAIS